MKKLGGLVIMVILLGIIIGIILSVGFYSIKDKIITPLNDPSSCQWNLSEEYFESQCYTNLQSTSFFNRVYSPLTEDHKVNTLKINIGRDFYIDHTADTGSMRPTLGKNTDLIFVIPKESEVKIGDAIDFNCNTSFGKNLLHRVIDINNGLYITKGDNNAVDDTQGFNCSTHFEDINGKLIGVIY